MTVTTGVTLELDDIQAGTLRARPSPYVGVYLLPRIDDRRAGRELLKQLIPALASAADPADPEQAGLHQRGAQLPGSQGSRRAAGFARQLPAGVSQGMAARADVLGDTGESAPDRWESPLGSPDVHIALAALSPDASRLEAALQRAGNVLRGIPGVEAIWRRMYTLCQTSAPRSASKTA